MRMDWFGFWIFAAVFIACDCWVFSQGYDSFFQYHKTAPEKEIQRLKIEALRIKTEAAKCTTASPATRGERG
jgi:hypothetical protein